MMLIIVADVALRNLAIPGLPQGLAWSNEISELMLYLITMCVAPWLLRQGQHIRVDIMLQAIPPQLAWCLEWIGDLIGFGLLRGDCLVWRAGGVVQLCVGRGQYQDAGDAGVVGAGALAFCVCFAGD
jgi:TRAP-type mannitol/chloroaromatic compound transport system permease small subunit